jgi:hypothetical protein
MNGWFDVNNLGTVTGLWWFLCGGGEDPRPSLAKICSFGGTVVFHACGKRTKTP